LRVPRIAILLIFMIFLASCPSGRKSDGDAVQKVEPIQATLVLPETAELKPGESLPIQHAASELSAAFAELVASGAFAGKTVQHASLADSGSVVEIKGHAIVAPGFGEEEISAFVKSFPEGKRVFVFSDSEWPDGSGVIPVSFDYVEAGFLAGALVAGMSKTGTIGLMMDRNEYRGRALASGVEQGSKWVRGGARAVDAAPASREPVAIANSAIQFFLGGGEFLVFDATVFGDYPVAAITGKAGLAVAIGRDENAAGAGACITSYVWDYRAALAEIGRIVDSGESPPEGVVLGLKAGVLKNTGFDEYKRYRRVDEELMGELEDIESQLMSGEIPLDRPARPTVVSAAVSENG